QLPAFNPRDVNFEHNMDYGAGAYLLAGSEVINLFCWVINSFSIAHCYYFLILYLLFHRLCF
ncbi:hypothetical protein, partial [Providencia rettgeri]|uniref:hypothetical protein n=1 Tax=Providencia rettgeri TaxID=587 RepID=UPI001C83FDFC